MADYLKELQQISQGVKGGGGNPMTQLFQLLQESDEGETPVATDAMSSYSSYIFNSFKDDELNTHVNALDNWYNQNLDNLTSDDIERYDLIKRRAGEHQKRYRGFDINYNIMHDNMEEMKVLLAGGQDEDGNIIKGYNELDEQGKALMAGIIKEKELQYIQNVENLRKEYGDLLTHPSGKFTTEFTAINSWDDIYQLGLVSIEDDVLDKDELYTLSRSIEYGNLEEYNKYMGIKDQTKSDSRRLILQDAKPLIDEVNYKGKLLDDYAWITDLEQSARTNPEAQKELAAISSSVAHSTEIRGSGAQQINPYASSLPSTLVNQEYTWQQLLDLEANDLMSIYHSDIERIQSSLYQLDQGHQNVSRGTSLTQGMPITFSGWGGKITDPYVRYEIKKPVKSKNKVGSMTVSEQKLINDYEKDYQQKIQLREWFDKYPRFGDSPEEKTATTDYTGKSAQLIEELRDARNAKSAELKALKKKWFKKQEHSYGGATWDMKPQNTAYNIYKQYKLTPIGEMFE
jgi:hypothetical protein